MQCPRFLFAVLRLQQTLEQVVALAFIGITCPADEIKLIAEVVGLEHTALCLQYLIPLLGLYYSQAIGHVHIVVGIEDGLVVIQPDGLYLLDDIGRGHIPGEFADKGLAELLVLVLSEQVHHTELKGITLAGCHVEGNLKHVVDGRGHDELVLLLHQHTVDLTEICGVNLSQQITVVDGVEKHVTVKVITGCDES